jgi:MFS family permease
LFNTAEAGPVIANAKTSVPPERRIGAGFILLYTLANIGAYIAFIPLLQILVPLQAAVIDPAHGARLLSQVNFLGAVAASFGNVVFGALSDRDRRRTGSRRNWVLAGLASILLAYAYIWAATAPAGLVIGVVAFQLAFNAMFAPLGAVLADDVPDGQKGQVSALLGLGCPLGNLIGTQVIGHLLTGGTVRYGALGALVIALVAPFAYWAGRASKPPSRPPAWRKTGLTNPFLHVDFTRTLAGRLLVVTALSLVQSYLLLYLRHRPDLWKGVSSTPEAAFAALAAATTGANVVCALASGFLSDRFRHRSVFVFAGGACLALGIAFLALAQDWTGLMAASVIYGSGGGIYYAVDLALIVQVLPSLHNAGKDLGVVNLSNTIPQMIAPLIALRLLDGDASSFRFMFLVGAAIALLGGTCVVGIGNPLAPRKVAGEPA